MLRKYSEVFRSLLLIADLGLVGASWLGAYWIRFHSVLAVPKGIPGIDAYLPVLALILPLWFALLRARRLYEPQRTGSLLRESAAVYKSANQRWHASVRQQT